MTDDRYPVMPNAGVKSMPIADFIAFLTTLDDQTDRLGLDWQPGLLGWYARPTECFDLLDRQA